MQVLRLTSLRESSPFKNFSVLYGKDEHIKGDEDFDYVLEIPGEKYPCLLTEYGFRTTVLEMRSLSPQVGKFRITPLKQGFLSVSRDLQVPSTTLTVDDVLKVRLKLNEITISN